LSSLKEDEEDKIKKILNLDQNSLDTTTLLKEVFGEDENYNDDKRKAAAVDKKSQLKKPQNIIPTKTKKPIVSKPTHTPRKPLNNTYEKKPTPASPILERKVSPIVSLEREMEDRREILKEHYSLQREEEAKRLLEDLLVDNRHMQNEMRHREQEAKSKSPLNGRVASPSSKYRNRNQSSRSPQLRTKGK
jgi:hypothetical protein